MMRWGLLVLLLWMTACSDAANDSLTSSLDQGNGDPRSACPGEEVNYTCTLVDMVGIGTTVWEGSAFNCPLADNINEIRLLHPNFNDPGGESGQCGALTVQSQPVVGNCYTSVLTVLESAVTEELNGTTIQCGIAGLSPLEEKTLTVIPLPAPTINITELTPESVSVMVNVTDYPDESEQCITNFTVEVTSGTGEMAFSESGLSVDIELDLCSAVYTFQGHVMSNSVSSNMSEEVELNSSLSILDPVTNLTISDDFVTLDWIAPANAPDNCIVNYQIAVSGFSTFTTITDNNSTSIPLSNLNNVDICEEHSITVAPKTVRIGVVETSRSNLVRIQEFPTPNVTGIDFVYGQENITVSITWQDPDAMSGIDTIMVDCDARSCQQENLTAANHTDLEVDYSDAIEIVDFTVTFVNDFCQNSDTTTTNFPPLLVSAEVTRTNTTSANILVVYNNSISIQGNFTLTVNVSERVNGTAVPDMQETFTSTRTCNSTEFVFIDLTENIVYDFEARVETESGVVIGQPINGSFTTTEEEPTTSETESPSVGPIVGGVVGGVSAAVIITMLILNPILIYIYWPDEKSQVVPSTSDQPRVAPPTSEQPCETWVTVILVLVIVTIPFVIYLYCCRGKKRGHGGSRGGGKDVDTEEAEYSQLARPGVMSPHSQGPGEEYGKLNLGQVSEPGGEEYSELRHQGARRPQAVPNPEDPMYSHL